MWWVNGWSGAIVISLPPGWPVGQFSEAQYDPPIIGTKPGPNQKPPPGAIPGRGQTVCASFAPLTDEERRQDERDRGEKLDEDVQCRARRVFERVADGVADDRRGMDIRPLADDGAISV